MALELIAGSVFGVLYDRVSRAVDRKSQFRYLLTHMKRTLESLTGQARFIREIREFNDELSLPNHDIADLETQMIEGAQLVGRISSLRMYNYCCMDGCHDQLYELNRSLDRLLDNLQLQQARDVKEILKLSRQNRDDMDEMKGMLKMILQQINDPEMKGLVKKLLEQNAGDSTEASTLASGSNTEREEDDGAQVESLEAAFRLLFDAVIEVKDKSTLMFGPIIGHLKSTLDCLKPLIEDTAQHNKKASDRPKKELETFGMQMKNGVELVRKCSKSHQWTSNETYKYTSHLFELDESLKRQLNVLIVQVARDVKETSVMLRNVRKMVERIEGISTGVAKNQQLKLDVVEANETRDVTEKTLVSARNVEADLTLEDGENGEVSEPPSVTVGLEDPPEEMRMSGQKPRKKVNLTRKLLMDGEQMFDPYKRKRSSAKERDPNMFGALKSLPGMLGEFSYMEPKKATNNFGLEDGEVSEPPSVTVGLKVPPEEKRMTDQKPRKKVNLTRKLPMNGVPMFDPYKRKRSSAEERGQTQNLFGLENLPGRETSYMELKKAANNFDLKQTLGRGGSGVFYKLLQLENLEVAEDPVKDEAKLNIIKKPCHKHLNRLLEYSSPKDLKSQMKYAPRVYYNDDAELRAVKIKDTRNYSGEVSEYSSPKDLKSQMKYAPRVFYNEDAELRAVKIKDTRNYSGDDIDWQTEIFRLAEEELKESNWVSKNVVEYERFEEICLDVERLIFKEAIDDIVRDFLKLEEEKALSNLYACN